MKNERPMDERTSMPPYAALKFVQKQTAKPVSEPIKRTASTEPKKKRTQMKASKSIDGSATVYDAFTTRIRRDLKRRLKRLSLHREEIGHEVTSIQRFVEEALFLISDN